MAVKTKFTIADLKTIVAQYDLGKFVGSKAFEQGQDQTNILLTTSEAQVVLRYYEKRTAEYAVFEIELLDHLSEYKYPCAIPYPKRDGDYLGLFKAKPFAIFEFLKGEHNDNPNNYLQVADVIGKLHTLTSGFKPKVMDGRPSYDQNCVQSWAKETAKYITSQDVAQKRLGWMNQQLEMLKLPANLPKGVCHGDVNPSNFLYQTDKLSAVLDFDQANYTWLLFDVANLIYWWTWPNKAEIEVERTKRLVNAYEQERQLLEIEKWHLYDALKFVILIGMGWFLHHDENYKNGLRKVSILNEMGREEFSSRIFEP